MGYLCYFKTLESLIKDTIRAFNDVVYLSDYLTNNQEDIPPREYLKKVSELRIAELNLTRVYIKLLIIAPFLAIPPKKNAGVTIINIRM